MKRSLADLQSAFSTPERSGGRPSNYYPFFKMAMDEQAVVRFLPDANEDNAMGFLVEKIMHRLVINGEVRKTPCLTMYGEECPICAVSQKFYKEKDDKNGSKYWKKKEHIGQVLVIEDPLDADKDTGETHEGKVRYINLSFQLFGIIKTTFEKGELESDPSDYKGGCNFNISKSPQGEYATYTLGSGFARKETDLDADTIAMIKEEIVDLSTLLPANPGIEKTEALLNAALTGAPLEENNSSAGFATALNNVSSKKEEAIVEDDIPAVKAAPKVEAAEEVVLDDDSEDILAKIRNRRKAKAAE